MMKIRFCGLITFLLMSINAFSIEAVDAGLQLYYNFSVDGGTVANDASGNGHDGIITGAEWQDGGPNGGYLYFDGNADFVNAGTSVNYPAWDQYTISIWFLSDGGGDNTGYGQKLLDKTSLYHDSYIRTVPDFYEKRGLIGLYSYEGGIERGLGSTNVVRGDNTWHHYVIVRDGADCTSWLDGEMTSSINNMISVNSSSPLYIGYSASTDAFQRKAWSGFIDEVRIYNRPISSTEVGMIWQAGSVDEPEPDLEAGLQLYYDFSSDDGAVATDASGEGHDGAITGAQWQDGGPNGGYLSFDGNLDYVDAGNTVNYTAWDQYTISIWFLSDGGGDNTGYGQKLFDKTSVSHDSHIKTVADGHPTAAGVMTYNIYEGGVGTGLSTAKAVRGDHQWHHIVIIRDGTNGTCWLDGLMTGSIHNAISVNSPSPLYIGYSASSDAFQRKAWSGFIDEVRIYNRPITSNEVSMIYQAAVFNSTLTVEGAHGAADLANGAHIYDLDSEVSASVPEMVTDSTTRYICTGATVDGNAYVMNGLTNVTMTITNDTTLTWNWQTQYKLEAQVLGEGMINPVALWQDEGSEVVLTATPAAEWVFDRWSGDLDGCIVAGKSVTISMSQARLVNAVFVPLMVMPLNKYAQLPENADVNYRRFSGSWFYSNVFEVNGIYCDSTRARGSSTFQSGVKGPGILSFEWELNGADGESSFTCSAGRSVRAVKMSAEPEALSVAVDSGNQPIRWVIKRGADSPEIFAVVRNVVWTPLPQASQPVPASGSVLQARNFIGLSWTGAGTSYRLYAGLAPRALMQIGDGDIAGTAVPADALADLLASANGETVYWRVDSVVVDSQGVEAVSDGDLWTLSVLPEGSPEFETTLPIEAADLKVGVFCDLPPFGCLNGTDGELQCKVVGGRLPSGLNLELRNGAVHIQGVPTRAGEYALTLQLSAKTGARLIYPGTTRMLYLTVSELGDIAGSYDGWLSDSVYGEGPVSMSVSSKGRVSGGFTLNGGMYKFRTPFFNALSNGCCVAQIEAVINSKDPSFPATLVVGEDGFVEGTCTEDPDAMLVLTRDIWRNEESKALLQACVGEYRIDLPASDLFPEGGGELVLSVTERVEAVFVSPVRLRQQGVLQHRVH